MVDGRITPFFNAFSSIGWTLLAILWFGLNAGTVIFAITAIILPICVINLRAGLEASTPSSPRWDAASAATGGNRSA